MTDSKQVQHFAGLEHGATRKHTFDNVSAVEMSQALPGLTMAQARIYAAAPELLAALEAASLNVCAAHGFPSRVHQQILRAIYNAKNNQK